MPHLISHQSPFCFRSPLRLSSVLLSALLTFTTASLSLLPQLVAAQKPPQEEQNRTVEPFTLDNRLDANSPVLEDDSSYYNPHEFQGVAGAQVAIELTSTEFDTYLLLLDPQGNLIATNDDSMGTNSLIVITLPTTGTYTIVAISYEAGATGSYTLSLKPATATEVMQAQVDELLSQGVQQFRASQFRAALQSYQQALELYQQIGNRRQEGRTLNNIGTVYQSLGQYPQALEQFQQALAISREVSDRAGEGDTLSNIGAVYQSLGQYPQALEQYQQALAITHEVGDRAGEGDTLSNIGAVYRSLGQYPQALEQYQQALSIRQEVGDRAGEGRTLNGIGLVYGSLGQYPQALEQYQQALSILQEVGDRVGEGATLNNIGEVYRSLGQYPQALEQYQQALSILQEVGDRAGEGAILSNIGAVYRSLGQYPQALEQYQQALSIRQEVGDRAGEGITRHNIGRVYLALGQYPQALEQYQQALLILQEVGDRAGEGTTLNNIGAVLYKNGQYAAAEETLFQALSVLESLRDSDLSDAQKVAIFETQRFTYQFLQQALVAQNASEKTLAALAVAERGRGRAFADLLAARQANPVLSAPPEVADIQRIAQQQNATLVQYSLIDNALGSELYIWVISPTGEIQFQAVDHSMLEQPLSEFVSASRVAIGVRGRNNGTVIAIPTLEAQQRQQEEQQQKLRQLHQLLIEPIAQYLPTHPEDHIIFIPQGELFLVPFPALVDAQGKHLIENHTILTAPSIQLLDFTQQQRSRLATTPQQNTLIVGNPTMPAVWNPVANAERQLPDLQGAEAEAIAIAQTLQSQPLLLDAATETIVKQQMPNARIIHFATHGLLDYGNPQESGVRDVPGAIALTPSESDDGLLTAGEILEMQLNADLVVLSACDTGRGRITDDGVIGLSRSLITAGVSSIVVSLWSVSDDSTEYLMRQFYDNLTSMDKAQALRQAMLTTMQQPQYRYPASWAAFTLIGEAE